MPTTPTEIRFLPVTVAEPIRPGDGESVGCGAFFVRMLEAANVALQDKDVLAVSSKVVSFASGDLVRLRDVRPTRKARILAGLFRRDPRKTQLVLEQGRVLVVVPLKQITRLREVEKMMNRRCVDPAAMREAYQRANNAYTFIVRKHAAYVDEAGIDHSNSPDDYVSLLPEDPCGLAREIRESIRGSLGVDVAVIVTDTVMSIGRLGTQDVAIGYAGIDPITRQTFSLDLFGVPRSGGIDLVIDSIAGMAGLVMGQTTEKTPAVVVRGVSYQPERIDELPGMDAVSWPAGHEWKFALLTMLATLRLWLGNLLACQPHTKKSRVRR